MNALAPQSPRGIGHAGNNRREFSPPLGDERLKNASATMEVKSRIGDPLVCAARTRGASRRVARFVSDLKCIGGD